MGLKRDRPDALAGPTQRVSTGWGDVYVTVNFDDDGEPFEVLVKTGKSGGLYHAQAEALGLTVSNALRMGSDARAIADDLVGIRSGRVANDAGDDVYSIPDAVGVALLRAVEGRMGEPVKDGLDGGDPEP